MLDALSAFLTTPREWDLLSLSAQAFAPAFVALLVCLTPRRWPELSRWVALAGAAAVLTLGLCRLIDYHTILDSYSDRTTTSLYHPAARLDSRSDQQAEDANRPVPRPYRSDDLFVRRPWAGRFGVDYVLGVDGLGLAVVLLVNAVTVAAVTATWHQRDRLRSTLALVLLLESAVSGAALAADLALFTAFAGGAAVAVAALLAADGRLPRRFLILAGVGSAAWLAAVFLLHTADVRHFVDPNVRAASAADLRQIDPRLTESEAFERTAVHTLDPVTLGKFLRAAALVHSGQADRLTARRTTADLPRPGDDPRKVPLLAPGVDPAAAADHIRAQSAGSPNFQAAVFALVLAAAACGAFAVGPALAKPPTAAGMLVAGGAVPLACLTLVRYTFPLAPHAAAGAAGWVAAAGVVTTLAGCKRALWARDLPRLAAAQLLTGTGFVTLGAAAWGADPAAWERGLAGAVVLIVANGLSAAGLVYAAGCVHRRLGHANIAQIGGLWHSARWLAAGLAFALAAGAALPGTATFAGQFAVLDAAAADSVWLALPATLAAAGLAVHRVHLAARLLYGPPPDARPVRDLDSGETFILAALTTLSAVAGVAPTVLLLWIDPTVQGWAEALGALK